MVHFVVLSKLVDQNGISMELHVSDLLVECKSRDMQLTKVKKIWLEIITNGVNSLFIQQTFVVDRLKSLFTISLSTNGNVHEK